MADEATTSDSQPQDDEQIGQETSDEATGTTLGTAQAEETKTEADESGEETSQTSDQAEAGPSEDEDKPDDEAEIRDWAAKKNLPLDDPLKIAKMYRESEKALGKKGQEEGQLKAAVDTASTEAGVDTTQALENRLAVVEFYLSHPDAQAFEPEMVKILEDRPWLAGDLETVLDAAKGRTTTSSAELVAQRQAGKQEALETAAAQQRSAPPRASATTRETPAVLDLDEVERRLADGRMSQDDYNAWRKDNDPFAAPA